MKALKCNWKTRYLIVLKLYIIVIKTFYKRDQESRSENDPEKMFLENLSTYHKAYNKVVVVSVVNFCVLIHFLYFHVFE